MRFPTEVVADWLEAIENEGRNLTKWETEFIISVSDQFDRSGHLSAKQLEIVERIYTERV